jgi:hypothetical protein
MKILTAALVLAWATAGGVFAEDASPPVSVRVIGEAAGAADPMPPKFVLDLELTKGDSAFQSDAKGWFAALPPATASGEISGTCVRGQCALSVDVDNGKLSLTGDIAGQALPSPGRFVITGDDNKTTAEGAVSFSAVSGPIADLGELAPPRAVDGAELRELLMWAAIDQGFSNVDEAGEPPDDIQLDGLASWQQSQDRPMTGLIFAADLAKLRADAQAAKAAAGWTVIGSEKLGWSAAYPAKLLPKATETGGEHRFVSADGRASLIVAFEPPMSEEAFSALVDKLSNDAVEHRNFTRVNGDMEISYVDKDMTVSAVYRNHARGFGRLVFTRPTADDKTYALFDSVAPASLKVSDEPPE